MMKEHEKLKKSIPAYVSQSARKNWNQKAITDINGSYTYGEVENISLKVALYIQQQGIEAGSRIALLMEQGKESVAAMLGILKAGCMYLFVDKKYPIERIHYMIDDSDAKLVIDDEKFEMITASSYQEALVEIQQYDGAYIIYTSGSTGNPKGLKINHDNFLSLYHGWAKEHFFIESMQQIRTGVIAPFGFDMCVLMIYTSLFEGYHLHIFADSTKQRGSGIVEYLDKHKIDIVDVTPNYLRLIDNYLTMNPKTKLYTQRIFCIGDVLGYQLARSIINHGQHENFQLYNTYGPAECTVLVTYYIMDKHNIDLLNDVPIGKPTANASLLVVDEDANPVSKGAVGELVILGECVGSGYISKMDINPNPFSYLKSNDCRSYKTGDLVKMDEKGNCYFIGRVDRQCKINGYRVEIEEIEHVIEKMKGVKEARVIVRKKNQNDFAQLYAFYCGCQYEDDEVKNFLKKNLPYYMIPQEVLFCSEFPITQNGKIDYACLMDQINKKYWISETEIGEFALQKILHLFGSSVANIQDKSFFELGGNSITLLALISSLISKFGINIDISELYMCKNIDSMLQYLRGLEQNEIVKIDNKVTECMVPIIESQKKIFDLERKSIRKGVESKLFHGFSLIYKIEFQEPINTRKLENAIAHVMDSNEIFYVKFIKKKGRCFNQLCKERMLAKIKVSDTLKICYLSYDSPSLVEFIQVGDSTLYLNVKHMLMDFVSVQYFLTDALALYTGCLLEEPRLGFITYLNNNCWDKEENVAFWRDKLSAILPRTQLHPQKKGLWKQTIKRKKCPKAVYDRLSEFAVKNNVSMFITVLIFFIKNIITINQSTDIRIGCYCPGRDYKLDNGVMGMFTNVLPFICRVDGDDILNSVKNEVLNMLQHQNISQSKLYQLVQLDELEDGELFDICFNYQNDWTTCLEQNLIKKIDTINYNPDITGRSFYFGVIEENGEILWEISYDGGKYTDAFIEDFLHGMNKEVVGVCKVAM